MEEDEGKAIMPDRKPFKTANNAKFRGCGTMRMPSLSVPSFKAAKQWFKQKVGAADRTKEGEDFVESLRHLDKTDAYLRRIFVQAKRTVDRWQNALAASETLLEYSRGGENKSSDAGADGGSSSAGGVSLSANLPKFGQAMDDLIEQDELINTNIMKFNKLHAELLRDQIERVLVTEAEDALKAKRAYFHSVLEYDACRANVAHAEKQAHLAHGPPNLAHAKEYLRMAKTEYENKKKSVLNSIRHLNSVIEKDLVDTIKEYTRNKSASYLRLGKHLEDLQESLSQRRKEREEKLARSVLPERKISEEEGGRENGDEAAIDSGAIQVEVPNQQQQQQQQQRPAANGGGGDESDPIPGYYDHLYTSTMERRY